MIKELKYNEYDINLTDLGHITIHDKKHNDNIVIYIADVPIIAELLKDLVGDYVEWKKARLNQVS